MNPVKSVAKQLLSLQQRQLIRRQFNRIKLFGTARKCPCCNASLRHFLPFGVGPREEAQCPICGSLERHRLTYLYINQRTNFFDGKSKKMSVNASRRTETRPSRLMIFDSLMPAWPRVWQKEPRTRSSRNRRNASCPLVPVTTIQPAILRLLIRLQRKSRFLRRSSGSPEDE